MHLVNKPDLRGHVVRSPTESVRGLVEIDLELAHPKVHQPDVALVVQQEVVQLQVPVNNYIFTPLMFPNPLGFGQVIGTHNCDKN